MVQRWVLIALLTCLVEISAEPTVADSSANWPRLFGPTGDSVVPEQPIKLIWEGDHPRVLWERGLGESYSGPAIAGERVVVFHREGEVECVVALDAKTGWEHWRADYPTQYVDQYGYNNGPRATPIIAGDDVYTLGAEGKLTALRLATGEIVWQRWLNREFNVSQDFFGVGGSPALDGDRLIVNVGGAEQNAGVAAFDCRTGKTLWTALEEGPSYATPVVAEVHGKRIVIVFTKSGLSCLSSADGQVHWKIPFRSRLFESVNATTPIVVGDVVLASATYGTGSLCVRIKPDFSYEELWRSVASLDSHFSNLLHIDGRVVGFAGRHEQNAELRSIELSTGKILWSVPSILGRGSMVRVGDKLILWGERGHLLVRKWEGDRALTLPADPDEVESILRYPCWTPPAIAHGRLYLRHETKLVCFDLRP
jgi:outer membrane protein assembly factor BamB